MIKRWVLQEDQTLLNIVDLNKTSPKYTRQIEKKNQRGTNIIGNVGTISLSK